MSCLLQVSIHIFYMYGMSDHIQNKLIHIQWKIGTYQSHIKYIQGQIRLIHRLIHLVIVLLNFRFQKCRDPNPRLDPIGGSKPEPDLLRHFQLSSQNILFVLLYFRLFNYAEELHFGSPINIYKFKRLITFTFNKMHLQNNAFIQCLCIVKDT